ncbi:uncharacterized protein LOC144633403 [Oculina patagonica]
MAHYHCCVPLCNNDQRKSSATGKKLKFFNFPKDGQLRKAWIIAIRRDEGPLFKIQKDSTLVCSEHFKTDEIQTTLAGRKRLRDQAVPSVFAWTKTTQQRPENVFQRRKKLRFEKNASSDEEASKLEGSSVNSEPTAEEQLKNRIAQLEEQIAELEEQVAVLSLEKFGLERFSKDPEQIKFYTGFGSYELLKSVFNWLQPYAKNMATWSQVQRSGQSPVDYKRKAGVETSTKCTLPLFDQFFLFLVRIKQGFPIEDLAVRFKVSPSTVSRVFLTWANFLYFMLGQVPIWPSKAQVRANLPDCFRATYPHTCVILDCTEIKVQTPSSKVLNSEFYSSYKSHTTYKGLVGISPKGAVSFVSSLSQGSISDKEITRQSGILDLLEEGTEVMADKGFLIDDLLNKVNVKLAIPPFSGKSKSCSKVGNKQFTSSEVSDTQEIARLRIHVERAIRRVKEYHFFDRVQPLVLGESVNQRYYPTLYSATSKY